MHVIGLKCRECGKEFPHELLNTCSKCFGPLEVNYNFEYIQKNISKGSIEKGPKSIWRYKLLLPIERKEVIDLGGGYTPLHRCKNLAKELGLRELYVKDDTTNPTNSFKDRVVPVAVTKALEFNMQAVGCASTGNLAASLAAHAAKANLDAYIFIPSGLEIGKIVQMLIFEPNIIAVRGTYDNANRLATEVADIYNWAFVNINVRPYYVEGSKTSAYEIVEQLDWNVPDRIIIPLASGALFCSINRGLRELEKLDLIEENHTMLTGTQPKGCSPIVDAWVEKRDYIIPVEKPSTIAKSLAIGDPADGYYAIDAIKETKGNAYAAKDKELIDAIKLLARTEGIFAEPGSATTIAGLKALSESGDIDRDETIVCYITGSGLKTTDSVVNETIKPYEIDPTVKSFEDYLEKRWYHGKSKDKILFRIT